MPTGRSRGDALNDAAYRAAVVDYGLGNLYSVKLACDHAGLSASITSDRAEIERADAVILPGVGAFGDAMSALRRLDLVEVIQHAAAAGVPLFGICLGAQLLLTESHEFGIHRGLDIIPGEVVRLKNPLAEGQRLKVPHVGWNAIRRPAVAEASDPWQAGPLCGLPDGTYVYFVHSYILCPTDSGDIHSLTRYGDAEFCSAIQRKNVFATQFHPERSGVAGLDIYAWFAKQVSARTQKEPSP